MTSTERLYFSDPFLHRFTGRVLAHGTWNGAASVVLDRSAFYPEAGGQMADRGLLGGLAVKDVQVDDAGVIHHVLDVPEGGRLPEVGADLSGEIDKARRRVHMALHTGQHMLSRALVDVANAHTVSSRLGETLCTIDVDLDVLDERGVAEAEQEQRGRDRERREDARRDEAADCARGEHREVEQPERAAESGDRHLALHRDHRHHLDDDHPGAGDGEQQDAEQRRGR